MSISLSSKAATRASLLALALVGISTAGMTSASAATVTSYSCTGSAPEVCFGLTHNGDTVTGMTVQVKPGVSATVFYWAEDQSELNPHQYTASTSVSGSGWAPAKSWLLNSNDGPHNWCGFANVSDDVSGLVQYVSACVNL